VEIIFSKFLSVVYKGFVEVPGFKILD